ncbi:unannotated protein [freshwater metagenome]|uniref:Unannotated protein n=1 Tax=freshwater metagenome TaxID=449393 RepID=A0A6J7Y1A2_9ZZZZ|nr:hypothetical protein [Actinomycetota bacterium]
MSIPLLSPAFTKSRKIVTQKSARAALKLVTNVSPAEQVNRKFFATFATFVMIFGLAMLLVINTLLAQDAFTLAKLQNDSKLATDQYEALSRTIEKISSPEELAVKAKALGMEPAATPTFVNLNGLPRG